MLQATSSSNLNVRLGSNKRRQALTITVRYSEAASVERSAFSFDLIAVGLVLWLELEVLVCRTQEHFTDRHR